MSPVLVSPSENEGWLRGMAAGQLHPEDRAAIDWVLGEVTRLRADLAIATEALKAIWACAHCEADAKRAQACVEDMADEALKKLTGKAT